jgi:hypothetical protein
MKTIDFSITAQRECLIVIPEPPKNIFKPGDKKINISVTSHDLSILFNVLNAEYNRYKKLYPTDAKRILKVRNKIAEYQKLKYWT